jgi:hypothetical protein
MARGFSRGRDTDTLTADAAPEVAPDVAENATLGAEAGETAPQKRAPRKPIDVGDVVVTESTVTEFATRATPMDSNPVALAVKNAEQGRAYDLHVDADKVKGVLSILRRAGQRYGVGVNIAPEPRQTDAEGKTIVTFKTGAKRVRGAKQATAEAAPSE